MVHCEICDQELAKGEFEEKLGICPNCIMIDCKTDSYKSFYSILFLFLGGVLFIVALLVVLFIITSQFGNFGMNIIFIFPPLIVCVVSGSVVIYCYLGFKIR